MFGGVIKTYAGGNTFIPGYSENIIYKIQSLYVIESRDMKVTHPFGVGRPATCVGKCLGALMELDKYRDFRWCSFG